MVVFCKKNGASGRCSQIPALPIGVSDSKAIGIYFYGRSRTICRGITADDNGNQGDV